MWNYVVCLGKHLWIDWYKRDHFFLREHRWFPLERKKNEYFHSMRKSRDQIGCFSFFLSLVIFCYLACCYFVLCYVGFAFRLNPLSTNLHKDILHRSRPFLALSRQILQINRRKTNTLFRKMEFTPKNRSRNPRILISGVGRVVPLFAASVSCSGCWSRSSSQDEAGNSCTDFSPRFARRNRERTPCMLRGSAGRPCI